MKDMQAHYDTLLARHYTWLFGGREANEERNRALFDELGVVTDGDALAVDLGAGSGFHTLPLLQLGFRVTAVDCCATLLDEVREQWPGDKLTTVVGDARDMSSWARGSAQLVLCMGDTLSHFDSRDDVTKLFTDARDVLSAGGQLMLSFRDLSQPLVGTARFLPVRSDDDRIFTCFLEYLGEKVQVHDVVYERMDGEWRLYASAYPKIVIARLWLLDQLADAGYTITHDSTHRGMHTIAATRP
jgi:SAM-dependent methyltransferase